ncbi:hypothetical protein KIN20_006334 [Parelaphostrongylus tenuis]|uniref:Uncharacterized protein n=1 Tax=Parelaphostrongylus tenuis TaxID=148309 RepID=A0AAD5QI83_PARTN|nr:hypothetical protein KIN20_006334 [Parelaphostrongylus tenuis]
MEEKPAYKGKCLGEEGEKENFKKESSFTEDRKFESNSVQGEMVPHVSGSSRIEMISNDNDEATLCFCSIHDSEYSTERISAGLNAPTENQKMIGKPGTGQKNAPKKTENNPDEIDFANALNELRALTDKDKPNVGERSAMLQQ